MQKKEDGEYPDESQGEEVIGDYKLNEKNKNVSFTNEGMAKLETTPAKAGSHKGSYF
ncbi:hypothetical protein MASR2M78_00840 [Treponema sp.]